MKRVITLLAVAALMATTITETQADFIQQQTGNTSYSSGIFGTGYVNYAVFDNSAGGNWLNNLGAGGASLNFLNSATAVGFLQTALPTGAEKYVFFYQIQSLPGSAGVTNLNVPVFSANGLQGDDFFQVAGYLDGLVFSESVSGVLGTADTANSSGNLTGGGTNNDFFIGANTSTFTAAGAVNPTGAFAQGGAGNSLAYTFNAGDLGGIGFSSVLFATSNSSQSPFAVAGSTAFNRDPWTAASSIDPGGTTLLLPHPNPEPGSLVLLSMGMAGVVYRRRKKKLELLEEESTEIDA